MKAIVNPYSGVNQELITIVKRFGGDLKPEKKPACKDGTCPIPKPPVLMTRQQIHEVIEKVLKNKDVTEIFVVSMNQRDHLNLVGFSLDHNWGKMKSGVTVKICL